MSVLGFLFSGFCFILCGISGWQYATATEYDSKGIRHPMMKRMFGISSILNGATGFYLIFESALTLTG